VCHDQGDRILDALKKARNSLVDPAECIQCKTQDIREAFAFADSLLSGIALSLRLRA